MEGKVHLTARESEVLRLLARGCTYLEASAALGVSRHTVASHIKSAYQKLGVHSAVGAGMRAIELRLLTGSWDVRRASRHLRSADRNSPGPKR